MRFTPVVPALFLAVLREFVFLVTVLTAVRALHPAGVILRMRGNPTAHNYLPHDKERATLSACISRNFRLTVFYPGVLRVLAV